MLPILVDLQAGIFEPVYAAIRKALAEREVELIDLSRSLDGPDSDYWILPFDQTPERGADAVFARVLTAALSADAADPK